MARGAGAMSSFLTLLFLCLLERGRSNSVFRRFDHMERMNISKGTKEIHKASAEGNIRKGRPRKIFSLIENFLEKARMCGKKNGKRRACMKRSINI